MAQAIRRIVLAILALCFRFRPGRSRAGWVRSMRPVDDLRIK
jgi:hypothetical protein